MLHTEEESKPVVLIAERDKRYDLVVAITDRIKIYNDLTSRLEKSKKKNKTVISVSSPDKKNQRKTISTDSQNSKTSNDSKKIRSSSVNEIQQRKNQNTSRIDLTEPIPTESVVNKPPEHIAKIQVELLFVEIDLTM